MGNNRNRNRNKKRPDEDNYVPPFPANLLIEPVASIGLREDTLELLQGAGFATVLDVVKRTDSDFYRIMRFNKRHLADVKLHLAAKEMFLKPQPEPANAGAFSAADGGDGVADRQSVGNADGRQNTNRQRRNDRGDRTVREDRSDRNDRGERNDRTNSTARQNTRDPRDARGRGERSIRDGQARTVLRGDDVSEKRTKELKEKNRPAKTQPETVQDLYVKINKGGKWGFGDRKGNVIVAPVYDEVYSYKEELCCVEAGELAGYIDREGTVVIEPQYECASSFSEGYACVFKGGKCGYIDRENNVVVDFAFEAGTAFVGGSCRVKRDGKWGELYFVEREDGSKKTEIRWIV